MFRKANGEPNWLGCIPIVLVLLVILFVGSCSFTKVSSGHVGVRVDNLGSGAGVSKKALGVGWYFTPPSVDIYQYPVFTNNLTWEQVRFQDKNGLSVSADVSVAYKADPVLAPRLFQTYRTDIDGILAGPVHNTIRNAIVSEASTLTVDQIYGSQKAALIERARVRADTYLSKFGLRIDQLFWAGNINLPESIQSQINARVANEQQAIAEQAKVATATAQSDARIAQAKGKAEALRIENEAIANNKDVLELRAIEKWNGRLPQYWGAGPLPFIGDAARR